MAARAADATNTMSLIGYFFDSYPTMRTSQLQVFWCCGCFLFSNEETIIR